MATVATQPTTLQDHLKTLEDILGNLRNLVPNEEQKGENYHSFGTSSLYTEQEKVDNIIGTIKSSYDNFVKVQNPSIILKHVTERVALNSLSQPIVSCLQDVKNNMRKLTNDNSLKSTVQKLEVLCAEEGLRFDKDNNIFISCDMFYIEIALDSSGMAEDVKVHYTHTGDQKSLKELVNVLRKKDFDEFHAHLKGLKQRYLLLKGDTFKKSKVLSALDILEDDIMTIMKADISSDNIAEVILSGPVGYITPTVGGRHLSMTYFADPLELLDTRQPGLNKVFTREEPPSREFGHSMSVCIEQSHETLLPARSMVSVENGAVTYLTIGPNNSEQLAARFVLQFQKPLPTSVFTAKMLQKLLMPDTPFFYESYASLDDLIIEQKFGLKRSQWKGKEYFVELPEEVHVFRCLPAENQDNVGLMLSKVPFTQLIQLPQIVKLLRCQAMYNTLLCSCFKSSKNHEDDKKMIPFDVKASDENVLTVNFIHPIDETLGSIDFVVTTEAVVACSLNILPGSPIICHDEYLDQVINRCMSIPLVMRCLINKSKTCRPEQVVPMVTSTTKRLLSQSKILQKPLKLVMPTIAQMQANHSLMSPQLTNSPSAFLTGLTPGSSMFLTPGDYVPGGLKRKRSPSNTMAVTPSTPTDGSRTPSKLKLPKITLKRKRTEASEFYEIDKTKSEIDTVDQTTTVTTTISTLRDNHHSIDSLSFVFPQFQNDAVLKRSNSVFSDGVTFPELAGIPLDSDADLDNLLGIPHEPFVQNDPSASHVGGVQPAPFDIDAIRVGTEMNFDTLPSNAIDPSALVTTPTSFDIDTNGLMDIDSLM